MSRPPAGAVSKDRAAPHGAASAAPFVAAGLIIVADVYLCVRNPQDLDRLLINAMLALSAFATLHARLLSLASAGFAAIGAYASAILAVKLGLPVFLSVPAAALLCGIIALIIGLPVLRLTDVYLAICTLGFGEIVRVAIILLPGLTGGSTGANLSTGFAYETMKKTASWSIAAVLAALCYLFWAASRSKSGRALRAIRENPEAAETMGVEVVAYKNMAFLASAVIAGLAGAFYAHSVGSLDNGDFRFNRAVDILGYAVLGGSGAWFGPILGAGFLTAVPILLRDGLGGTIGFLKNFAQLPNILTGLALMLVIIFAPGGLASAFPRARPRLGRVRRAAAPAAPAATSVGQDVAAASGEAASGRLLLSLKGLGRSFGGVEALADLTLEIGEGKIYGLIGPNGAGKTTLINIVSGLVAPSSGSVEWLGDDMRGRRAHRIARAGIARTFQNIELFGEMSVLENVVVGHHIRLRSGLISQWLRLPSQRREEAESRDEAMVLLGRLGLAALADQEAAKLSYGDQRRVEIARALALEPRLLLLDEPAAGMNERETSALGDFIVDLKRHGVTMIVVEHHMDLIMEICDEIAVLNFGRKIAQGAPAEVSRDEAVLEAYLGEDVMASLLEVRGLDVRYGGIEAVRGLSFSVEEGRIVAVIGANGAGKSSTLLALSGLVRASGGAIRFRGRDITALRPDRIVRAGLVQVPEGRAILAPLTVAENLGLGAWTRRDTSIAGDLERVYGLFPALAGRRSQVAGSLSGGEQQMLAIGRALMASPKLLLLDEPSMGLAPKLVSAIFETVAEIRRSGTTILLVEQNARQALRIADSGLILAHGTLFKEGPSAELLSDPEIIEAFLGKI